MFCSAIAVAVAGIGVGVGVGVGATLGVGVGVAEVPFEPAMTRIPAPMRISTSSTAPMIIPNVAFRRGDAGGREGGGEGGTGG